MSSQASLFPVDDDAPDSETRGEGRALRKRRLSARDLALVNWIRSNGPVSTDNIPLGAKAADLRRLAFEGLLVSEGAQVQTFRIKENSDG